MERLQRLFGGGGGGGGGGEEKAEQGPSKKTNPVLHGIPLLPEFEDRDSKVAPARVAASPAPPTQRTPPPMLTDVHADASVTETRLGQLMNQGREVMLKVVPLREGDCLSCKVISCGVVWAAAAYVVLSIKKGKARYTGIKRTLFTAQALSLSAGLALLGAARFFDLSIFAPREEGSEKKGLTELLQDDLNSFHRILFRSSSPSPASNSENKTDS